MLKQKEFFFGAYWKNDFSSADTYITNAFRYINELSKIFDNSTPYIVDNKFMLKNIPNKLDQFKLFLLPMLYKNQAWYFNLNQNRVRNIELDYTSDSGFYSQFIFDNDNTISIKIRGGCHEILSPEGYKYGNDIPNSILIEYSYDNSSIFEIDIIKQIFLITVKIWNPFYCVLSPRDFLDLLYDNKNDFQIGWVNYINRELSFFTSPSYIKERFESGTLIILSEKIPQSDNIQLLNNGKILKQVLQDHCLLKWV